MKDACERMHGPTASLVQMIRMPPHYPFQWTTQQHSPQIQRHLIVSQRCHSHNRARHHTKHKAFVSVNWCLDLSRLSHAPKLPARFSRKAQRMQRTIDTVSHSDVLWFHVVYYCCGQELRPQQTQALNKHPHSQPSSARPMGVVRANAGCCMSCPGKGPHPPDRVCQQHHQPHHVPADHHVGQQ